MSLPAAILFDMDGTLADSESLWSEGQKKLVESLGGEWSEELNQQLIGQGLGNSAEMMRSAAGSSVPAQKVMEQMIEIMVHAFRTQPLRWLPGAVEAFELAEDLRIPTAVVTSSHSVLVDASFSQWEGPRPHVFVAGDQVSASKPDPEGYLQAARRLSVAPSKCVAVEDSLVGVKAVLAAGTRAVAVRGHQPIPDFPGLSRITDLRELDEELLRRLTSGEVVRTPGSQG